MRDSINGAWLLGIILTFMAIFIAFITIMINYKNAFDVKTRLVTCIEEYQGFNPLSVQKMQGIMRAYSHMPGGRCGEGIGGTVYGLKEGHVTENPVQTQHACVTREIKHPLDSTSEEKYYYNVEVFFGFELPVLGEIFTFHVNGETNAIHYPAASDYFD